MRLTTKCEYCGKNLITDRVIPFRNEDGSQSGRSLHIAKCGHLIVESKELTISNLDFNGIEEGKSARDYQKQGVTFAIDSQLNCIIGDQMRLGKTPQSLLAVREASKTNREDVFPLLIVVKSANLWQWIPEYKTWTSNSLTGIYPIIGTKGFIPPGFDSYIISMDTFSRNGMIHKLSQMGFKTVIVDEAHSFKNTDSNRALALVNFIKENNIKHKIFLSGTPLKNRAEEFFVLLNLCAPAKFPSLERFRQKWLEKDHNGRWSRVSEYAIDAFREEIAPFYIRREKEDVYSDLPALDHIYTPIKIEEEHYKKLYNSALDEMETKLAKSGNVSYMAMQENLMFLRRICGMAKTKFIADYVDIFLEDSESAKIAIGIHHEDVRTTLKYALKQYNPITLSGEDTPEQKYNIQRRMTQPQNRLLISNMLAGGVGCDFHSIDNAIIAERAWSPADETQFEFRFYNPDKSIKDRPTTIEYILAEGTIDYFFHDMIREKRKNLGPVFENNWNLQADPGSFKELIERTISSRL